MIPLLILAADDQLYHPRNLQQLAEAGYRVTAGRDWKQWSPSELLAHCRAAEVIITGRRSPHLPEGLIDDPGRVRWLCHLHGTVRHLVSREHIAAGLQVTNWGDTPRPVAQGSIALLLATLHQVMALDRYARTGRDERICQHYLTDLPQMQVGLYGYGPIGRQIAEKLKGLGATVAIHDPYASDVPGDIRICPSLETLFETSHAVIVICGLNEQTRGSVTRQLLERLPQGGVLINTARGPIVEEQALADLVGAGRILAGCDVIEDESNWPASPLAQVEGAILTRHQIGIGVGQPPERREHEPLPDFVMDNLTAYREGRPLQHLVSADVYDLKT